MIRTSDKVNRYLGAAKDSTLLALNIARIIARFQKVCSNPGECPDCAVAFVEAIAKLKTW
jgi:hypothetical protein